MQSGFIARGLWLAMVLGLSACRDVPGPAADATAPVVANPVGNPASPPALGSPSAWQCGDLRIETRLETGGQGRLQLALPGGDRWLEPSPSASGARYRGAPVGEAPLTEFWSKGEEARLSIDGDTLQCRPSDTRPPWAEAQADGAQLRAVGQEPGWVLTVENGADGKRLRLQRMGQNEEIWHARRRSDGLSYETLDREVMARVAPGPCVDTMSGDRFPVVVTVQLDDLTLRGCGRHYAQE